MQACRHAHHMQKQTTPLLQSTGTNHYECQSMSHLTWNLHTCTVGSATGWVYIEVSTRQNYGKQDCPQTKTLTDRIRWTRSYMEKQQTDVCDVQKANNTPTGCSWACSLGRPAWTAWPGTGRGMKGERY